jgi:hypothetical protein
VEQQRIRDSLTGDVKAELRKDADSIDAGFIDQRIDELYALDGRSPPKPDGEALRAAARTVRSRAAWRRRAALAERTRKRRAARGVCAACCAFLFLFSANYAAALLTGSCLPSKAGITICCGTAYCLCDTVGAENENPSRSE